MNEKVSAAGQREAVPSILSANVLYLLGIIMVLTAGVALLRAHFGWGLLATELLIGALAMLWVRLNRLPWRPTLRLTPATGRSLALAFFMGLGLWLLDSWLGAIMSFVLGYDVPVPPDMYPQNLPAAILLFVALGLGAPLGEELFFRGYLQRAYESMRPGLAIVLVALLFALFHVSLVGLTPRLPVALALGYVAWRSGSPWPGVALHAANNGAAVVFDAADSRLQAIDDVREFDDAGYTVTAQAEGEDLVLQVEGANIGQSTERIQPPVLVDELWPWQLMALPFTTGASYEATLVFPQRFDATLERSALTVTDASVVIGGVEPLKVPAGNFFAWRVTVGEEAAWYDTEPLHKLLQYDSGPVIWQLRATAAES